MTNAEYLLELDKANDGSFSTSGDNIIGDTMSIEAIRGRDYPSQLVGKSTAGRLSAVLRNDSNAYSPFNTLLRPGLPVRFRAGLAKTWDSALFVAANSEYLSIADNVSLSAGDVVLEIFTIIKAVSLPGAGATMGLVAKGAIGAGTGEYALYIDNTAGTIRFKFSVRDTADTTTTTVTATTFGTPSIGINYFVHVYHDPTGNVIGIAVNNGTADTVATSGGVRNGAAAFEVGRHSSGNYFDGQVSQLSIFKHATTLLTSAQRVYIYNNGSFRDYSAVGIADTNGSAVPTTLVEWWRLDELSGNRVGEHAGLTLTDNNTVLTTTGLSLFTYRSLWTGVLDVVEPTVSPGPLKLATLKASGKLIELSSGKKVNPPALASPLTGAVVTAILVDAGLSTTEYLIDAGQSTIGRWFVEDKAALEAVREIEETELGFFYENASGVLVFEDRHARLLNSRSVTSQATFSDAVASTLGYTAIAQQDPLREVFNEVLATVQSYTVQGLAVLWTLMGVSPSPTILPGASLTVWAQYPNAASGGDVGAYVDAWTTPVVGTDITQTGVANGDIAVVASKFARSMKITITNNHATATATITLIQARGTAVVFDDPVLLSAEDTTSQSKYGERSYRLPGPWLSFLVAQDFVNFVISRYKDPTPILTIEYVGNKSLGHMQHALDREISDKVTVDASNNAGLGVNDDFFIENIRHIVDQGLTRHVVSYDLAFAGADAGYWIIGVSLMGIDTKLAY